MKIGIIGGGPAGFAAAIKASKNNNQVTILEKNNKVLKKLLLTGNGKCNYFNADQDISKYHSGNEEEMPKIINEKNIQMVKKFWEDLGIIPLIKNGYYYPFSGTANSMKMALVNKASDLNINIITDCEVLNIIKEKKVFKVTTSIDTYYFDKIIIATGSYAYPQTGSTGFGYEIAQEFNHTIVPVCPSLVQLKTNTGLEKKWQGIRSNVIVGIVDEGEIINKQSGEMQFTDYGISGICAFNISGYISFVLRYQKSQTISINFIPWYQENDFKSFMTKRASSFPKYDLITLCETFLNYKLIAAICHYLHIDSKKTWYDLSEEEQVKFASALRDFRLEVIGTKDYLSSQVCRGGIPLIELDLNTLESFLEPNLYFAGEIIDIDGDCGGYNLTIAILTGIIAGISAAEGK